MKRKPETSILSIRLRKVDRDKLAEEAKRSGVPLSEYAFDLICQGIEAATKSRPKAIQAVEGEVSGKKEEEKPKVQPTPTKEQPKEAPRGSKSSGSNKPQDGPVDQAFLDDIKKRYPELNFFGLMGRIEEVFRKRGKQKTRKNIEWVFASMAKRRLWLNVFEAGRAVNK